MKNSLRVTFHSKLVRWCEPPSWWHLWVQFLGRINCANARTIYPAKFIDFTHIHTKLVCFPGMTRRVIKYKKAITYWDSLLSIILFHTGIPPFSEPPQPPNLRLKVAPSNPFLLLQVWFLQIPCFFYASCTSWFKERKIFSKAPPDKDLCKCWILVGPIRLDCSIPQEVSSLLATVRYVMKSSKSWAIFSLLNRWGPNKSTHRTNDIFR